MEGSLIKVKMIIAEIIISPLGGDDNSLIIKIAICAYFLSLVICQLLFLAKF